MDAALTDTNAALNRYKSSNIELVWGFRVLKAQILLSRSDYKGTLAILSEDLPPNLASTEIGCRRKLYQGTAHRLGQQFQQSEIDFQDAEKMLGPLEPGLHCQFYIAKAALDVDEKQYDDAEENYKSALAIARKDGLAALEVNALGDLGRLATSREHFDEAIDINQEVLTLSRSRGMQGTTAAILGNMGWAYFELGDFDNALDFFKQGAQLSEQSGLEGLTDYWFECVAETYMALHDYAAAGTLSKSTLQRARTINNAQTITECLNTLAELSLRNGKLDEADRYNAEANEMEARGEDHFGVLESALLSGRIETKRQHYAQAEKLFQQVSGDPKAETPLRWEVQARLAELYDAEHLPAKADAEYRKAIDTIEAARSAIDRTDLRLSYLSGGIEFYEEYVDFLVAHHRSEDALKVAELSRARTLEEGLASESNAQTSARAKFDPQLIARRQNATLLFYWIGQRHSYLWAITPTKTAVFSLAPAPEINLLAKPYREAVSKSADVLATEADTGEKLYKDLVEPAKKLIPRDSRVIILPAESLYGLNFETLIVPDPQPHFWIEDVTISTANSLTLLSSAPPPRALKGSNLLLVGNTEQATVDFPALPQAPAEMKQIEQYFPSSASVVLEGKQATPAAYLNSDPQRFDYVHFVTHGTASQARPLESAVILSRAGDSYKLYARDIVKHPLRAQLVTISACTGAGTRAYSGEGLVGLAWAFLRAGAHNVIAALWEVSDSSTPLLMNQMYAELSHGKNPATALRAAKLSLLHRDKGDVFRKPMYWAPFQLYTGS